MSSLAENSPTFLYCSIIEYRDNRSNSITDGERTPLLRATAVPGSLSDSYTAPTLRPGQRGLQALTPNVVVQTQTGVAEQPSVVPVDELSQRGRQNGRSTPNGRMNGGAPSEASDAGES